VVVVVITQCESKNTIQTVLLYNPHCLHHSVTTMHLAGPLSYVRSPMVSCTELQTAVILGGKNN
jgi:hypothetical protein